MFQKNFICSIMFIIFLSLGFNMYSSDGKEIELKLLDEELYFGKELTFKIIYMNSGKEAIKFFQPDKSSIVFFRVKGIEWDYERGIRLSKPRAYFGNGYTRKLADKGDDIILKPGESYIFDFPVEGDMVNIFSQVGKYYVYIEDNIENDKKYSSNQVELYCPLTEQSIPGFYDIITEQSGSKSFKRYIISLMKTLYPQFEYNHNKELSPEKKKQNEVQLEQFKVWWEQNKDSEEVAEKIKEINRKAGFEVE